MSEARLRAGPRATYLRETEAAPRMWRESVFCSKKTAINFLRFRSASGVRGGVGGRRSAGEGAENVAGVCFLYEDDGLHVFAMPVASEVEGMDEENPVGASGPRERSSRTTAAWLMVRP